MLIDLAVIESFARTAHAGQTYGGHEDYIEHPLRVAARLQTPLEKAVALLHDTVEDTDVWRT
jgi:Guanosine polyphosphate pyrophosphohydrolases/synthetases